MDITQNNIFIFISENCRTFEYLRNESKILSILFSSFCKLYEINIDRFKDIEFDDNLLEIYYNQDSKVFMHDIALSSMLKQLNYKEDSKDYLNYLLDLNGFYKCHFKIFYFTIIKNGILNSKKNKPKLQNLTFKEKYLLMDKFGLFESDSFKNLTAVQKSKLFSLLFYIDDAGIRQELNYSNDVNVSNFSKVKNIKDKVKEFFKQIIEAKREK
jgi:hypothetical protein